MVAHLSEGIPRYWLLDSSALETFVENELPFGLQLAVEAKVLADVNATSGIQTQTFAPPATTLRKGLTKLEVSGYAANSIVLHPTDWEGVELALSSTNAIEHLSLPYDPATRRLFGVPIVATVSQAAVWAMCWRRMRSSSIPTARVWGCSGRRSSNTDDFSKNLIRARCEGRFGTSVLSPLGVVSCDLTA